MLFQTGGEYGQGVIWQFMYDTNRPAFLEMDLVGLCVNDNWQIRVRYCEFPFTHNTTRSLSKTAGLLVSYTNCQTPSLTTFTTNFKLHTNSSTNHVTTRTQHPLTPLFHPRTNGTYNLLPALPILLLKKATVLVRKHLLCFPSINSLMTRTSCLGKCHSVSRY